ncbi:MAG: hypothetical protein QQM50_03000 [Dehalococcoides mccartyi]|jgi:hypothetical protein|uniref:hypothetical protein n=1 Tax=Dehalococcoides TaxID=61434 RepID=UPI00098EEC30|nr:hypothetical protein [Dehalococcoides mccartyi]AQU02711.1 hypothetical protein B1773_01220 [Dehalococcoides mccartyi]AQU04046.1 hypothetical protein B1774_01080 [Dehalococcoides mccartyi]MDP4279506.1 hypothetical protein [Dehalococcoides mccartyi]
MSKTSDAMISDLVGTFTDPIIVYPGGWGDTLPDWLKEAITLERLETNIKASNNDEPTGTNVEACAYLYTAGLTAPMDHDWSQIYLYVATQTYSRHKDNQVPEDIRVESLSDYQMGELCRLKSWLFQQRIKGRQEKDRGERRQARKEAEAQREAEQPALFEF